MCHVVSAGSGQKGQAQCGCSCTCPAMMTVEEEIRLLEEHRNLMQDKTGVIDRKIAALKSAKGP
jgi:hypothetical protein